MKSLAVLTSGGDAPGMNAAIRAVVRIGLARGVNTFGVYQGYSELIESNFNRLGSRDMSNIVQRGGTILGSARCQEFQTEGAWSWLCAGRGHFTKRKFMYAKDVSTP